MFASRSFVTFVCGRLALGILTLLLVSFIVFASTQALPGDAARAVLGQSVTPDRLAEVREQLHLNDSLPAQYWAWLKDLLRGDLGDSLTSNVPVSELVGPRLSNTAFLVIAAILIAFPLSCAIGAYTAYRRDSLVDHGTAFASLALAALPEFIIGLALVLLFSTTVLNILPAVSVLDSGESVFSQLDLTILPIATLVLWELPYVSRIMRASLIEVLESDYVEMARLKGMSERRVVWRHALPNAIVPTIQAMGLQIAFLAGGIVVVEFVFGFPGLGSQLVQSVADRDLPMIQAITLIIASVYVVVNLIADVMTIAVSPRLRTRFA